MVVQAAQVVRAVAVVEVVAVRLFRLATPRRFPRLQPQAGAPAVPQVISLVFRRCRTVAPACFRCTPLPVPNTAKALPATLIVTHQTRGWPL